MNPIDEAYKNKIGLRLARRMADALAQGEITEDETSEISTYVLENINKKRDSSELLAFLEELVVKFPIFAQILTIEQGAVNDKKEDAAIEHAENLIKENKIDEALNVMGNATNSTDQNKGEV